MKRLEQALRKKLRLGRGEALVTISMHSKTVDHSKVMKDLLGPSLSENCSHPRIFHLDIAPEVTIDFPTISVILITFDVHFSFLSVPLM